MGLIMNKISLALTLGLASQAAIAASLSERDAAPAPGKQARPAVVLLPSALQHERKVGWTLAMGEGRRLRLGLLSGRSAMSHSLPFGGSAPARSQAGLEFDQKLEWGFANIKVGTLRNGNPLLGKSQPDSPWAMATRTTFSSVSMGYSLTPSLALVGMLSFGRTSGVRNAATPGNELEPAAAAAISIGLSRRHLLAKGDQLGFAIIVPTRAAGVAYVDGTPGAPQGVGMGARYSIGF